VPAPSATQLSWRWAGHWRLTIGHLVSTLVIRLLSSAMSETIVGRRREPLRPRRRVDVRI